MTISPVSMRTDIYILESQSAMDVLHRRTEGAALSEALKLAGISTQYHQVINRAALDAALDQIAAERSSQHNVDELRRPFLHISAHGNQNGIVLTDETFITWTELREILIKFSRDSKEWMPRYEQSNFTLSISACRSANGAPEMTSGPPYACTGFVGATEDVNWSDSLTGFITFYHLNVFKQIIGLEAVTTMNHAAGLSDVFTLTISPGLIAAGIEILSRNSTSS